MKIVIDGPDQVLYQWDKGQRLLLHGDEPVTRVDFAHGDENKAIPAEVYTENDDVLVDIPDALLRQSGKITVYLVTEMEDREETICGLPLWVLHRQKPSDYVEPDEISKWNDLDRRLRPLEDSGIGDLTSADAGQLLYISPEGTIAPLKLGAWVSIKDGVLVGTGSGGTVTARIENGVLICEMEE